MAQGMNGAWLALGVAGAVAAAGAALGRKGSGALSVRPTGPKSKTWAIVNLRSGNLADEFDSDASTSSKVVKEWVKLMNLHEHGYGARDFKAYNMDLYRDRDNVPWKYIEYPDVY